MLIMGTYTPVIVDGSPEDTIGYWQDVDYYCTSWRQACLDDNHVMASRRTILHQIRNDARRKMGSRPIPDSEIHAGLRRAGAPEAPLAVPTPSVSRVDDWSMAIGQSQTVMPSPAPSPIPAAYSPFLAPAPTEMEF